MARVLVVDDLDAILKLVRDVAERMGFPTETLNDARRFANTFVLFKPDIVLLDIMMPGADGMEIIQCLIDIDYTGRLVIISGYADWDRMARTLAGATSRMSVSSLPKPFRLADLRSMLIGNEVIAESASVRSSETG